MGKIIVEVEREKIIRRYMSYDKFQNLLTSRSVYFSRFDKFDDHLEGGINKGNFSSISNSSEIFDMATLSLPGVEARTEQEKQDLENLNNKIQEQTFPSIFGIQKKVNGDAYLERISSWLYASCWTDLPHECDAMWKLYGTSGSNCHHANGCAECAKSLGNSVCIETTVGALADSIDITEDYNILIRKVEYIDHRKALFEDDDLIHRPFFSKALHFSYENEVRLMLWPERKDIRFSYKFNESTENDMYSVKLGIKNIEAVVKKIILSPLPNEQSKKLRFEHIRKYQSALGLQETLSNKTLKEKIINLLNEQNLKIEVIDSDTIQTKTTDFYTAR